MRAFALTCEALARLDSTEAKVQCAAAYLISRPREQLAVAARCLAGSPLPAGTSAPGVGGATIVRVISEQRGASPQAVRSRATRTGDLGAAIEGLCAADERHGEPVPLDKVVAGLALLGSLAPPHRERRLGSLYERSDGLEAKYLTKLLLGSLRTGMQSGRVEESIALAFRQPEAAVRRAHMLLGDIGKAAERAADGDLDSVSLRVFRPVRCMLAHPVERADDVLALLSAQVLGEHKYDGVRAQLHLRGGRKCLYSRSLEDCTHLFPELSDALAGVAGDWILDGEVVAWANDRALPFAALQQRLGRTQVPLTLLLDNPVIYIAFDVLQAAGQDLIDAPLEERRRILEGLPVGGGLRLSDSRVVDDLGDVRRVCDEALERGNEGALFKDLASPYSPGTRGRAWVKLKRPVGTLDVVVTAAEYGHGKRAGWLSDVTFAVRGPDGLLEVGKAYSGLTDAEIQELTEHFKNRTRERIDSLHRVVPDIVLEVAFGGIQLSSRHPSGYALRFARIVRRRPDVQVEEIDTLDRVKELYERQRHR